MKVNGQHENLDAPPSIPIFNGSTPNPKRGGESLSDALTSAATAVVGLLTKDSDQRGNTAVTNATSAMSPAKRAHVCGQYLDHLEKLKKLYESDIPKKEEFEEQKQFVLRNIRQINC